MPSCYIYGRRKQTGKPVHLPKELHDMLNAIRRGDIQFKRK